MPWNPSQPATTSQRSSFSAPSWLKRTPAARPRRRARRRRRPRSAAAAGSQARRDQVLDDLLLAVDGDRLPPVSAPKSMRCPLAVEPQLDAVVDDALALQRARRRPPRRAGRPCPARARRRARALDVVAARASSTTDSMPRSSSRCASSSPAGPAPTMATCVSITRRRRPRRARPGRPRTPCWRPAPRSTPGVREHLADLGGVRPLRSAARTCIAISFSARSAVNAASVTMLRSAAPGPGASTPRPTHSA